MQNYPKNLTLKLNWNPYLFINFWQKILTVFLYIEFDQTIDILNQKNYYFLFKSSSIHSQQGQNVSNVPASQCNMAGLRWSERMITGLIKRQKYFKTAKSFMQQQFRFWFHINPKIPPLLKPTQE